ncbi:MAG: hypothetical protein QXN59_01770 [Candidatus Micrarchaeaceae archaeon]
MGKKLRQQRRGKGSNVYAKLPGTFDKDIRFTTDMSKKMVGEVTGFVNSTGHTAPLMSLMYDDFSTGYLLAPEGINKGSHVHICDGKISLGSVIKLRDVPEGIPIYNVEARPGDGGKYVRAAGSSAYIAARMNGKVSVVMPSKQIKQLSEECRAQLGVVAGGGVLEQPLVKAGKNHYRMHAINRLWPKNRGVKMNPVDHPFGGKQHHEGKSTMTPRNAPPGRKVGHIAARRAGRKKRG